ncbi:hypothetical protein [Deinococcus petrolearius]|uniref:Uncharacterized protein n=1 Tax=Deinococcus petrolearius TaxID=1751295 RepID=A0ABW1DH81_9DEIO
MSTDLDRPFCAGAVVGDRVPGGRHLIHGGEVVIVDRELTGGA